MTRKKRGVLRNRTQNIHSRHVLSSQTIRTLKQIWNGICKKKNDLSVPTTNIIIENNLSDIKKNTMYSHIPEKIRHLFDTSTSQYEVIKCETTLKRGRKVCIFVVPIDSHINIHIYLNNIIAWLNFVSEIAQNECAQTLNIYLLLTDFKKELPELDTDLIDTVNANTAFTNSCSSINDIFVFRREEWFKVFIHETFHCFGLDFSASDNDEPNKRILSTFTAINPNTDVRLYETFCEMWAETIHLLFCLFTTKRGKCTKFSETTLLHALHKEQIFSIYQSNKILNHSGFKYCDLFSTSHKNRKLYTEKTQAFSYYVIKSILLWNFEKFMKWCVEYSDIHPMQFNEQHISKYCDFIDNLVRNDSSYRKIVDKIGNKANSNAHSSLRGVGKLFVNNFSTTLRMTAIDPEWY